VGYIVITKTCSAVGVLAGMGIGIFAAVSNFNPNAHQAESMTESNRVFLELLFQIGSIGIYSGALGFLGGAVGLLGDAITCCKFVDSDTKRSYSNYGSIV
jgi:hypothetical protein